MKELGAGSVPISSDLGQSGNMVHSDGLEAAVTAMERESISDTDNRPYFFENCFK